MRAEAVIPPFAPSDARVIHGRVLDAEVPARFRGAYVHVPFCFHKCHYCDFYSFVETQGREGAFVDRLLVEAAAWADLVRAPAGDLETLFVGGGTPTLLAPPLLRRLLQGLREILPWRRDAEWTVEANPETVTDEVAAVLAECGVNRVSVGCQSFEPALLAALERWHDPASVPAAVARLRAAGILNLNLDLIFAVPGASLRDWDRDLDQALGLEPTHCSCYGLTYEPNTPLARRHDAGEVEAVDEALEAEMYERTRERLGAAGFEHYEISNWARPGRRCLHNELYWTDADWLALGPSASGHAGPYRWKNAARLGDWLAHGPFSPLAHAERVSDSQRRGERFMLGLRRIEGLALDEVEAILSGDEATTAKRAAIDAALADGRLERRDGRLRFTPRGLLLADTVLAALV